MSVESAGRHDVGVRPDNGARRPPPDSLAGPATPPVPGRDGPTDRHAPLLPAALALVAATVALLAGGWLMYAPFAFGYQDFTLDWNDATTTDFYTGLGLAILALLGLAASGAALRLGLRARGAITPRTRRGSAPEPAQTGAGEQPTDELTALLRPLVAALNRDLADRDTDDVSEDR